MTETIRDLVEPSDAPAVLETAEALAPILYEDLRRLARRERRYIAGSNTLQTTALIHEAYLKMRSVPGFNDRAHFLRASALSMRHILTNYARDRIAAKRGGGLVIVPLEEGHEILDDRDNALVAEIGDALTRLAALNLRLARVVECRFFAGYTDEETALALNIAIRTVRRDWATARAWLLRELDTNEGIKELPS